MFALGHICVQWYSHYSAALWCHKWSTACSVIFWELLKNMVDGDDGISLSPLVIIMNCQDSCWIILWYWTFTTALKSCLGSAAICSIESEQMCIFAFWHIVWFQYSTHDMALLLTVLYKLSTLITRIVYRRRQAFPYFYLLVSPFMTCRRALWFYCKSLNFHMFVIFGNFAFSLKFWKLSATKRRKIM